MPKKIIVTGGHYSCAAATMDELLKSGWHIFYIGRKYSQEEDKTISAEYKGVIKEFPNIKLLLITTGKLQRFFNLASVLSFGKIPIGILQSLYWLSKFKPNLVLSFGGYVALPVVIAACFLRIRVITHEQTRNMGLANKIISIFAYKVCLSWPNDIKLPAKFIITGLPIRSVIQREIKKIKIKLDKPLLYISGGSLGSHAINDLFYPILRQLLEYFSIIHQCGSNLKYNDYERFVNFKKKLSLAFNDRYIPVQFIDPEYLGFVYNKSKIVIGRAGANTVYELSYFGIPAIFIPLPFSANNEQLKNAQFYADSQAGIILSQSGLNSLELYKSIFKFYAKLNDFELNSKKLKAKIIPAGAKNLKEVIEDSLH